MKVNFWLISSSTYVDYQTYYNTIFAIIFIIYIIPKYEPYTLFEIWSSTHLKLNLYMWITFYGSSSHMSKDSLL